MRACARYGWWAVATRAFGLDEPVAPAPARGWAGRGRGTTAPRDRRLGAKRAFRGSGRASHIRDRARTWSVHRRSRLYPTVTLALPGVPWLSLLTSLSLLPLGETLLSTCKRGAQMTEIGSTPSGRSRRARIAVPFVVGAMAGATVIGGVALVAHDQGSNGGAEALAAATPGTAIAMKAQSLSAEQIYRLDSPGVVDISVTTDATHRVASRPSARAALAARRPRAPGSSTTRPATSSPRATSSTARPRSGAVQGRLDREGHARRRPTRRATLR